MPDIAMCPGGDCPLRKDCWRFVVTPDRYQSYMPPAYNYEEETCEYYWPTKKGKGVIK